MYVQSFVNVPVVKNSKDVLASPIDGVAQQEVAKAAATVFAGLLLVATLEHEASMLYGG